MADKHFSICSFICFVLNLPLTQLDDSHHAPHILGNLSLAINRYFHFQNPPIQLDSERGNTRLPQVYEDTFRLPLSLHVLLHLSASLIPPTGFCRSVPSLL